MKSGLGLYPHLLSEENYRFVYQAGATHIVAHLPGFARREGRGLPTEQMWTLDELSGLKREMNAHGLEFAAIENFEVEHWYDVLLDGPRRDEQIEGLKQLLRNMGELGIGVMGYNFSYANVWGTIRVAEARGGAPSPGCRTDLAPSQAETNPGAGTPRRVRSGRSPVPDRTRGVVSQPGRRRAHEKVSVTRPAAERHRRSSAGPARRHAGQGDEEEAIAAYEQAMADQLWRDMAQQRIWQLRPPETEDAKREFFGKSHSPRP